MAFPDFPVFLHKGLTELYAPLGCQNHTTSCSSLFPKPGTDQRICGCFILAIIVIILFPRQGVTSENTWHRPCPAAPGPEAAGGALTSARSCGPLRGGDKPVGSLAPTLLFWSFGRKGKNTNLKLPQEPMSINATGSCVDVGHYGFKHGLWQGGR